MQLQRYQSIDQFLSTRQDKPTRLIALDRITNPQNLGMIIRSVCAGNIDGLLLPQKGCAALSPLVIKASTGTLFKTPVIYCDTIEQGLKVFKENGAQICTLSLQAKKSLFSHQATGLTIYVLGNETEGVSPAVAKLADQELIIPMQNNVESLNVAITAALIAFNDLT
jgi:23S rRNA (guanosine2251-2'-O)-methyltransferase